MKQKRPPPLLRGDFLGVFWRGASLPFAKGGAGRDFIIVSTYSKPQNPPLTPPFQRGRIAAPPSFLPSAFCILHSSFLHSL
jgi:hypothetical protein